MKAIVLKSFGGPESFELCDVPKPVPQAGRCWCGCMPRRSIRWTTRSGAATIPIWCPLPTITGHDVSGVIEAVGLG